MKKFLFLIAALCFAFCSQAAKKELVTRIEPTDWYVGMKNPVLQLMVYGPNIANAQVDMDAYPGTTLDSIVRPDSPNYLFLYLNLDRAPVGTLRFTFTQGKQKQTIDYALKAREMKGEERIGFDMSDVLYMLMPDRFSRVDGASMDWKNDRSQPSLRHGGNLEGIRQHLDYFCDLGVTALWFTPVLENMSPDHGRSSTYHGYATTDYYKVDPRFGTNEQYRKLTDEAHAKGLKVVMDMIFNHCGFDHPWVADMPMKDWFNRPEWLTEPITSDEAEAASPNTNGQSVMRARPINKKYLQTNYKLTPVLDPYASQVDLAETVDGWFVPSMPDLNQRNPHVMRYLTQNSIWWIETVGINGIRMDTYPYADAMAMTNWMRELEREYPQFNIVGESWVNEPAYTAAWQGYGRSQNSTVYLKTVMDFTFHDRINRAVHEDTDGWNNGMNRIYNTLAYDYLYPRPNYAMAFIENHDTDRFLRNGRDLDALRQALALLLTMPRTPQLYYGTEVLLNGTKERTDGYVRKDFPGGFPGDERNLFDPSQRDPEETAAYDMHRRLLQWRKGQGKETITKGQTIQFIPKNGIYVLARKYKNHTVATIINGTNKAAKMKIARYAELLPAGSAKAHDVLTDSTVELDVNSTLDLAPRATMVLEY